MRYDSTTAPDAYNPTDTANLSLDDLESGAAYKTPSASGPAIAGRSTSGKKIPQGAPLIPVRGPSVPYYTDDGTSVNAFEHHSKTKQSLDMMDPDSAANSIYAWPEDQLRGFAKHVWSLGGIQSPDDIKGAIARWTEAVGDAFRFAAAGQAMEPQDAMDMMLSGDPGAQQLRKRHALAGQTITTQKTNPVDLTDPVQVKTLVEQAFKNQMGRGPTDAELRTLTASLHSEQKAHPGVTKVQDVYDENGNRVSQTSLGSTGGVDAGSFLGDQVTNDPEAAEYQAAAGYFPALMRALGPMGGMG